MNIWKIRECWDEIPFSKYEQCPNKDFIHLNNNIFLLNDSNQPFKYIDESTDNFSRYQSYEILEFPNEKNKKLFKILEKLNKLK